MTSVRNLFVWMALGALVLLMTPARAGAQQIKQGPAPRIQSVEGVDSFKAYCSVCHGVDAKGNGPAAQALKKAPADLTAIAKRNGGTFSATDVEATITGAGVMISHGSRDMPIWGPVFRSLSPDDSFMKLRLSNLVTYLKSIQGK